MKDPFLFLLTVVYLLFCRHAAYRDTSLLNKEKTAHTREDVMAIVIQF